MANRFEITLSAKDKFSAVLDRLNRKTKGTAADGGKEIGRAGRATEVWAQNFERVTRAAGSG